MRGDAYDPLKRGMDVFVSLMALILLLPVQLVLAVVVLVKHGRPVIFTQPRPGLNGKVFKLYKFRSMRNPSATLVTDEQRLTSFGKALRATSLDELPSLVNVLKGEMSLVGPRPLLVDYLELYTPEQARRHEVRPGVTGLAQVKGRNGLSWDEKFAYDVEYVENRSLMLDLKILIMTAFKAVLREGISANNDVTMPRFTGAAEDSDRDETR